MVFKNYTFLIYLRISCILLNALFIAWLVFNVQLYYSASLLFFVLIAQSIECAKFVSKTNADLARFIEALQTQEFNINFPRKFKGNHYQELYNAFNRFLLENEKLKNQQETHFQLINTIINQIKTGIIGSNQSGKIVLMNQAAGDILKLPKFDNLKLFEEKLPQIFKELDENSAQTKKVITIDTGTEFLNLSVYCKIVKVEGKSCKIFTFDDINKELNDKELEAWNKLISILTHEIMNSVTPIISLSESAKGILASPKSEVKPMNTVSNEDFTDIQTALNTIHKRSLGLLKFVENYRKVSKIPIPDKKRVLISDLINYVTQLFQNNIQQHQIELTVKIPNPKISLFTDAALLEQVLINLILNAIDALEKQDNKQIKIEAFQTDLHTIIEIEDNGCGIKKELLNQIFVPFFTTKTKGSGIGLSLSKQIINTLGGTLKIATQPEIGTKIWLQF